MKLLKFLSFFLILQNSVSCQSPNQGSLKPENTTLLLGHRATGSGVNNGFLENTIPAINEALKYGDGIEVDIQMSSSNTIWLFHDASFTYLCPESQTLIDSINVSCILNSPDSIINQLKICRDNVSDRIYELEELMKVLSKQKDKVVSLDVKGYFYESCVSSNNVSIDYLDTMAYKLYKLISKHNLTSRVIIETGYTRIFETIKKLDTSINCHLLAYNSLASKTEKASSLHLDGISFNVNDSSLTAENKRILDEKNLQLQLWTIKTMDDLKKSLGLKPYSVQIGSLEILKISNHNKNLHRD